MKRQMNEATAGFTGLRSSLPARVILTDDPMRARMLAAHWLDHASTLYELRGMVGFAGSYRGADIALLSSGFGGSAALLYLHEAAQLGARRVIYMGECFSRKAGVRLRDVVVPEGGDSVLLRHALAAARQAGLRVNVLCVASDDRFFLSGSDHGGSGISDGVTDPVSGEIASYAAEHGIALLSILTVSRHTDAGESLEEHERQSRFHDAARLTFETFALDNEHEEE
jgi:purine-nucleoside phosphorylase